MNFAQLYRITVKNHLEFIPEMLISIKYLEGILLFQFNLPVQMSALL